MDKATRSLLRAQSRLDNAAVEERIYRLAGMAKVEARAGSDEKLGFYGHSAVFNERTPIGNPMTWGFYEQCGTGCFDKTLQERGDVYFCQDHDPGKILSRVSNGTCRLSTDSIGLINDSDMAPVSYARDISILVERGDIKGQSFRFQVVKDDWVTETIEAKDSQGNTVEVEVEIRTLLEVRLIDVTVTAIPAYPQTDASMRTAAAAAHEMRELYSGPMLPDNPEDFDPDGGDGEDGDDEDNKSRTQPAPATAPRSNDTEPAQSTRTSMTNLRLRHQAIAHRHGLPLRPPVKP